MSDKPYPTTDFFPTHHRQGLFYSDAWQQAWLNAYGDHPDIQLHPDAGIYTYRQRLKGLIPIHSATLIGATSPATHSIRAEYTCLTDEALSASLNAPWHQLVLPDILVGSDDERRLYRFAKKHNLAVRQTECESAYAVDLRKGSFSDYLSSLGKNTRLQLHNRRKRIAELGSTEVENIWPDSSEFIDILNHFHLKRWGKPCYTGQNLEFIESLLEGLHDAGHRIDLSVITLSDKPISVALDINVRGRQYNLQSGYIEEFDRGISLGKLHLGFQIEQAFERKAEFYDFMVGSGKNFQYKQGISTAKNKVASFLVVKDPFLKAAYKASDRLTVNMG